MRVNVRNDFRIGGPSNLLLVEVGQSQARLVWLVDYDRWRDEHGVGTGEPKGVPDDWLVSVVLFQATEEAFDRFVRTGVFWEHFTKSWNTRREWEAP